MAADVVRPADPAFAPMEARVSFADGPPFLLISEQSLADLNRRLAKLLPMNRFRPNLRRDRPRIPLCRALSRHW